MHIYYYTSDGNLSICMHEQESDAKIPVDYASILTYALLDYIFTMDYGLYLSYEEINKNTLCNLIFSL